MFFYNQEYMTVRDDIHNAVLMRNAELRIINRRLEESKITLIGYKAESAARSIAEAQMHVNELIEQNLSLASTIKEKI